MMVCFRDNGPGLDEKRLKLFGQIQQSTKGSSGLGTYLAVRLLMAADIEVNYFNRTSGGFEVQLAL
jgi:K+-sensing histidine kinase KdpD